MAEIPTQRNILVAPLNWGLGHATRCIPIIRALEENGFMPILASDGAALELLRKEFPNLRALELPSYGIQYPKNGRNFKWKMLKSLPKITSAVRKEKQIVAQWIKEHNLSGIISDNRFGVVSAKIPSVYLTHQLNVLTGSTSLLTGKLHRQIIKKFTECWIPDTEAAPNLSGKLGHLKNAGLKLKYLGPLSRFESRPLLEKYDLAVVLSGPEPQRGMLERKLEDQIARYSGKVIFIRGIVGSEQKRIQKGNVTFLNFMTSAELEKTFKKSKLVLCRSGYSTIMDLARLGKKAFFIPTPGQYEQEYLARKLKDDGFAPYAKQEDFRIEKLDEVALYQGLPQIQERIDWKNLFCLFERE